MIRPRAPAPRRAAIALAAGLALLVAADQALQHTALADGRLGARAIAPFDPPLFCDGQRASLARIERCIADDEPLGRLYGFDTELGWAPIPGATSDDESFDANGCRIAHAPLARARDPALRRIVTIGCSFTEGAEVRGPETWAARYDEATPGVEVANLGAGMYGIDQALLRLRRDGLPLAPDEVWLGVLPHAALRVVTGYVPAHRHWEPSIWFKPTFALDDAGALALAPCPARTPEELVRLVTDQAAFVEAVGEHDLWVRRTRAAYLPRGASALHRTALGRLWLTWRERRGRDVAPWMADPDSPVHRLMRAIALETRRTSEEAGARFRLIVLPSRDDLAWRTAHGGGYWDGWVTGLRAEGVEVLDLSAALAAAGALDDDAFWAPRNHYSEKGNRAVAEALARALDDGAAGGGR